MEKQVWVKHDGEWFPHGDPLELYITALDSAYHRICEGYTVCVTKGDMKPGGPGAISHEQVKTFANAW